MSTYEAREKRILDAIALREPDRVPISMHIQTFHVQFAGLTVADIVYDMDKNVDAMIKYLQHFLPDTANGVGSANPGIGPLYELMKPKAVTWAGAPDGFKQIDKNSIHQFIEFPVLLEEEMEYFSRDYSGWLLTKGLPRCAGIWDPFEKWNISSTSLSYDASAMASFFSTPAMREMIQAFWKIGDLVKERQTKTEAAIKKMEALGFPIWNRGNAGVPFDTYSDFFRGTEGTMVDLFENRALIEKFCELRLKTTLNSIRAQGKAIPGKWVFMPLHKGMDKFLDDEQYENLYWKHLQAIINEEIKCGLVPYVYTEGWYDSRIKFLKDVPTNKVIYHFEYVDLKEAKKVLGNTACLSGGFPLQLLHYGTKQQVIDEVKRIIDICAPGGGYIFSTTAGLDNAPVENVEAMFETVKTYGKK